MAKKILIVSIMVLALLFNSNAWAQELLSKQQIREQPVNALDYAWGIGDVGLTILLRLAKTMDPVGLFNGEIGVGGVEFTLIEQFIWKNLYLTGGWTVEDEKPKHALYGVEVKLDLKGDLGKAISNFRPGVYWSQDKIWFGASLEIGGTGPKI